jgi:hypothetical protein
VRRALLLSLVFALVLVVSASASWKPAVGNYTGAYMGCVNVHFGYSDYGAPHVAKFHTRCDQPGQPYQYTRYFDHAPVHDYKFAWTSHEHPLLRVEGRFTGTRSVTGTIWDRHGVAHHWVANLR